MKSKQPLIIFYSVPTYFYKNLQHYYFKDTINLHEKRFDNAIQKSLLIKNSSLPF